MFGRKLHFAVSERMRASFCKNTDLKIRGAWPDVWGALPEKGFQPEAAPSEIRGHPVNGEPTSPWVAVAEDSRLLLLSCGVVWRLAAHLVPKLQELSSWRRERSGHQGLTKACAILSTQHHLLLAPSHLHRACPKC